jgi:hypothetical protein
MQTGHAFEHKHGGEEEESLKFVSFQSRYRAGGRASRGGAEIAEGRKRGGSRDPGGLGSSLSALEQFK